VLGSLTQCKFLVVSWSSSLKEICGWRRSQLNNKEENWMLVRFFLYRASPVKNVLKKKGKLLRKRFLGRQHKLTRGRNTSSAYLTALLKWDTGDELCDFLEWCVGWKFLIKVLLAFSPWVLHIIDWLDNWCNLKMQVSRLVHKYKGMGWTWSSNSWAVQG